MPEYDHFMGENNSMIGAATSVGGGSSTKEVKGKVHTYYQVLIDSRDCPYINPRAQTESVTFLGNHSENARNLYAVPGLDYVAHEDIMPYTTQDKAPIQHELFDKFLQIQDDFDSSASAIGSDPDTESSESKAEDFLGWNMGRLVSTTAII